MRITQLLTAEECWCWRVYDVR